MQYLKEKHCGELSQETAQFYTCTYTDTELGTQECNNCLSAQKVDTNVNCCAIAGSNLSGE